MLVSQSVRSQANAALLCIGSVCLLQTLKDLEGVWYQASKSSDQGDYNPLQQFLYSHFQYPFAIAGTENHKNHFLAQRARVQAAHRTRRTKDHPFTPAPRPGCRTPL